MFFPNLRSDDGSGDREFFFKMFRNKNSKFSKLFGRAGLDLHEKMNPGRRNLSVVKVSASYDIWRPKKYRKTENKIFKKFRTKKLVFRNFGMVFEELQPNEPQNQVRRQILLQIHIS